MGVEVFKYGSSFSSEFVNAFEPRGDALLSDGSVAPGLCEFRRG